MNNLPLIIVCGISGVIYGLIRRRKSMKRGEGFISITANDYTFSRYATIPYLSFIYAIYQGGALGLAISMLLLRVNGFASDTLKVSIVCPEQYYNGCHIGNEYLWLSLALIVSIGIARISIEGYIVLFKVAQIFIDKYGDIEYEKK